MARLMKKQHLVADMVGVTPTMSATDCTQTGQICWLASEMFTPVHLAASCDIRPVSQMYLMAKTTLQVRC